MLFFHSTCINKKHKYVTPWQCAAGGLACQKLRYLLKSKVFYIYWVSLFLDKCLYGIKIVYITMQHIPLVLMAMCISFYQSLTFLNWLSLHCLGSLKEIQNGTCFALLRFSHAHDKMITAIAFQQLCPAAIFYSNRDVSCITAPKYSLVVFTFSAAFNDLLHVFSQKFAIIHRSSRKEFLKHFALFCFSSYCVICLLLWQRFVATQHYRKTFLGIFLERYMKLIF